MNQLQSMAVANQVFRGDQSNTSTNEGFSQKQAQKNLIITSSNASNYAIGDQNVMANDTFE